MHTATVGRRYQVVIPKEERKRVRLKPASKVSVEAKAGCIVIYPVTAEGLRGIGSAIADSADAMEYVKRLRSEWEGRA
jgi:AbrB family looped-hinge helix DNA binding protein